MAPLSLLVAVSVVSAAVSVSAFALSPISPGRATGLVSSSRLFSTIESPPTAPCETSPLQAIVDERREFEINLGRAIDTLRADYPDLLKSAPDFDIYSEKIVAVDPGGAELVGITAYKRFFKFLHMAIGLFYNKEESGVTFKLVYDWARGDIRVSWHASVMPKVRRGARTFLDVSVCPGRAPGLISPPPPVLLHLVPVPHRTPTRRRHFRV